ncbi:MAG: bifunctional 23S rRNA (guanine(2069)-N(7))-methyltransferase RlmK/23S rRNA (guanine(2445)-N(2))-methyltransferase RlmL [Ketobacter sp.]
MNEMDWNTSRLVITCAGGLERFLLEEIQGIGGDDYQLVGSAVEGPAGLKNLYQFCLWSRIASRILLPIAEFEYKNEQEYYESLRQVHWQMHMDVKDSLSISVSKDASVNLNTQYIMYKTKDAIVDHFRDCVGDRPNIDTRAPDLRIHVHFGKSSVQVSLELSGEPLHRRGYRVAQNEAPIKETLAAALLMSAGWPKFADNLIDPMCGSGTLLIEAAMMKADIAPGLIRKGFGFERWRYHDETLWQQVISEAAGRDLSEKIEFSIKGYDADQNSIQSSLNNIRAAGLNGCIHVERRELINFSVNEKVAAQGGVVVINPPYGERLDKDTQLIFLYRAMARLLQKNCMHWSVGLISNQVEFVDALQLEDPATFRVYNGPIRCVIRSGKVVERPAQYQRLPLPMRQINAEVVPAVDMLNRIRKNVKTISKWVEREQIAAYRIYNADIPEYNLAIDWYNGHLQVQEYAPPKTVDPDKAARRLQDAIDGLRLLFDISFSHIHVKSRQQQKGRQQYQKLSDKKRTFLIEEERALLLVNLDDYLDTGVFLDHRPTRIDIQKLAKGKRFLNLFCYTGAGTVHAALGGAKKTVSVDMSATYLNWARNNLYINGCSESVHELIQTDCLKWLKTTNDQFDVIFLDPPTFSNSKRMDGHFDVQKSQVELLDLVMKRLEPGGVVIFSNNFNKFKLEPELEQRYDVKDRTKASLPPDFSRGKPVHFCWEFRHKAGEPNVSHRIYK